MKYTFILLITVVLALAMLNEINYRKQLKSAQPLDNGDRGTNHFLIFGIGFILFFYGQGLANYNIDYKMSKPLVVKPSEMNVTYDYNSTNNDIQLRISGDEDKNTKPVKLLIEDYLLTVDGKRTHIYDTPDVPIEKIQTLTIRRIYKKTYDTWFFNRMTEHYDNYKYYQVDIVLHHDKVDEKAKEFLKPIE